MTPVGGPAVRLRAVTRLFDPPDDLLDARDWDALRGSMTIGVS